MYLQTWVYRYYLAEVPITAANTCKVSRNRMTLEGNYNFNVIKSSAPKRTKNLLNMPPLAYPSVPSARLENTMSNVNIGLRGNDISRDLYFRDEN